jgi:hypothetical protein
MRHSVIRAAVYVFAAILSFFPAVTRAQERPAGPVAVFLDCQSSACDFDFLRQQIAAVSWVRDRTVADVHVLVTEQGTGAGGQQFQLAFLGLARFAGMGDTLTYSTDPTDVEDDRRKGIARVLHVGLARFVVRVSGYDAVTVRFEAPEAKSAIPLRDRWNYWVFEAGVNGDADGDRTDKFIGAEADFEASRITNSWKTSIQFNAEYNQSTFSLSEGGTFTNIQRNYDVEFEHVKSVGRNFAVGVTGGIGSSTFSNQRRVIKLAPAIEFDLFPYSEATRRSFVFQYAVGMTQYVYEDTTIFLKLREGVPVQQFRVSLGAKQPWGQIDVGALFRNQIMKASKRRASIGGEISFRVVRGLNLEFGGDVSNIHDQINLRLGDLSDEEVLVRQTERGTSYRYNARFGISYTFGSLLNNFVNPRFNVGDFF